jgi:hypothetical protein
VLQPKPRPALLRGSLITALALAARGILHGVAFIEDNDAVEVGA